MPKIEQSHIEVAYRVAKRWWDRQITERAAVDLLVAEGFNRSSASDYIRNFGQMMRGERYHRTLSLGGTRHYFSNILVDFGPPALVNALKAARAHIAYYASLKNGGNSLSLVNLCDEFDKLIGSSDLISEFEAEVHKRADWSVEDLQREAKSSPDKPEKVIVYTTAFRRNPSVVQLRLRQAKGICGRCRKPAPFKRATGEPYLEVHHKLPLSQGGDDIFENTIALCPNCHREAHFGSIPVVFKDD
mgnify:CR=1 FL=1